MQPIEQILRYGELPIFAILAAVTIWTTRFVLGKNPSLSRYVVYPASLGLAFLGTFLVMGALSMLLAGDAYFIVPLALGLFLMLPALLKLYKKHRMALGLFSLIAGMLLALFLLLTFNSGIYIAKCPHGFVQDTYCSDDKGLTGAMFWLVASICLALIVILISASHRYRLRYMSPN
jgi:hypothetical protein